MNIERLNIVGGIILDASIEVHKILGPGLLEIVYELALYEELLIRGLNVTRQFPFEVRYKNKYLGKTFFIDLMVEEEILIEIKAVKEMNSLFEAQLITYLKLTDFKLGYLINFNVPLLKYGFKRIVNKI